MLELTLPSSQHLSNYRRVYAASDSLVDKGMGPQALDASGAGAFVPDFVHAEPKASRDSAIDNTSQTLVCLFIDQFLQTKILSR